LRIIGRNTIISALLAFILGLSLALQVRTHARAAQMFQNGRVSEAAVDQFLLVTKERARIVAELERLRESVLKRELQEQIQSELGLGLAFAGLTEVSGPGVSVMLADPYFDRTSVRKVGPADLLLVLNDLRASGAEAIAVNGRRVTPQLAFARLEGENEPIMIGDRPITGPVRIEAIGDPELLLSSLQMRGGVVQQLMPWIRIHAAKAQKLWIPAADTAPTYRYARPVR
jgi:uncharacterized protein YlxW (UPF0749 family)